MSVALVLLMIMSVSQPTLAQSDIQKQQLNDEEIQVLAEKYEVNLEEIANFNDNLKVAYAALNEAKADDFTVYATSNAVI